MFFLNGNSLWALLHHFGLIFVRRLLLHFPNRYYTLTKSASLQFCILSFALPPSLFCHGLCIKLRSFLYYSLPLPLSLSLCRWCISYIRLSVTKNERESEIACAEAYQSFHNNSPRSETLMRRPVFFHPLSPFPLQASRDWKREIQIICECVCAW